MAHKYFDRKAYNEAFRVIRDELDRWTYRQFYYAYQDWLHDNKSDWWLNEKWREGIREALCQVKPSDARCIPEIPQNLAEVLAFRDAMVKFGVWKIYGPNWEDNLAKICAEIGEENYQCEFLRLLDPSTPEISLKTLEELGIQAYSQTWAKWYADFDTNLWFTEPETY